MTPGGTHTITEYVNVSVYFAIRTALRLPPDSRRAVAIQYEKTGHPVDRRIADVLLASLQGRVRLQGNEVLVTPQPFKETRSQESPRGPLAGE